MRKKLIIAAGALVVLIAAAAVLPAFLIDEATVKREIARAVYDATGRDLTIDGDVGFSLLPSPRFSAAKVRLSNWDRSTEPAMLDVRKLTIAVSPLDLLSGNLVVRALDLDSPRLLLESRDGRGNWDFLPPGKMPPPLPPEPGEAAPKPQAAAPQPAAAPGTGPAVQFDSITVRDGQVVYRDLGGRDTTTVSKLAFELEARSLQGPFLAKGSAVVAGQAITFKGDAGRLQAGHAIPLRLDLMHAAGKLHLDGLILRDTDEGPVLKAALDLSTPDLAAFATAFGLDWPQAKGQLAAFASQIRASATGGEISEGQLRLGANEAEATASWRVDGERPKVSVRLSALRLDADSWRTPTAAAVEPVQLPKISAIKSAVAAEAATIPAPRGVDVDLHAEAAAVIWRGAAIGNVVVDASAGRGDIAINQISADLPGAAQLRVFGFVDTEKSPFGYDLTLQAAAGSLRGSLDWLGVSTDGVPADRLRTASLAATLRTTGDGLWRLRDLDLILDASRAKGAADIRWGDVPAVGLTLSVDQINLDAYRAAQAAPAAPKPVVTPAAASADAAQPAPAAPAAQPAAAVAPWNRIDANLDLRVGRLTLAGQGFDRLAARGRWQDGVLDVAALTADIGADGRLDALGKIATRGDGAPRFSTVKVDVTTPRADRILSLVPVSLPRFVSGWRTMTASLAADGPLADFRADLSIALPNLRLALGGRFDGVKRVPTSDGELTVSAADLGAFAAALGGTAPASLAAKKPVNLNVPVHVTADGFAVPAFAATAGDIAISGDATVKTSGDRPRAALNLKGNVLPLFDFPKTDVPRSAAPAATADKSAAAPAAAAPGGGKGAWTALRDVDGTAVLAFDKVVGATTLAEAVDVSAGLEKGILTVDHANARVFGGPFKSSGSADLSGTPKIKAKIDWTDARIERNSPLFAGDAPLTGTLALSTTAESQGDTRDSLLRRLDGKGEFSLRDGSFAGVDLGLVNERLGTVKTLQDLISAIGAAGRGGRTQFFSLAGHFTVAGGVFQSEDIALEAPSGRGTVTGNAALADRRIDTRLGFTLASLSAAPPLGMRLQGLWDSPRVFFDTNAFQAYMVEKGVGNLIKNIRKSKGKDAASSADEPPPPNPGKLKTRDVVREILQAIPAQ